MTTLSSTRSLNKLTTPKANSLTEPGRYSDGGGLYLRVLKNGSKSWTLRLKVNGRNREIGLGAFKGSKLAEVRALARKHKDEAKAGVDPIATKVNAISAKTFKECIDVFLASKEKGWKSDKHRSQWRMTLNKYGKPLHNLHVDDIKTPDVLKVLEPIWLTKHETASRLRGRIEAVLDYAKAMGWRSGENPAVWRGNLRILLPQYSKAKNIKHHAAVPFEDMPEFIPFLRSRDATTARLLEFIILTAARSGEVRNATFDEVDTNAKTWTIPAERMKMNKEHVVPLSRRALAIILEQAEFRRGNLIFPNPRTQRAFDVNATRMLLKRMECGQFTTHGFRSTFRDWAGDKTMHQRETIEAALAHSLKDKAEAAYRRSSALEKRRKLMQDWADYCDKKTLTLKV